MSKKPQCPECNQTITFLQSFKNINPWVYKCPNCQARIKASQYWKILTIIGFFLGVAIASFAIYQEEKKLWETSDSLMFFGWVLLGLLPLYYLTWLKVDFEACSKKVK